MAFLEALVLVVAELAEPVVVVVVDKHTDSAARNLAAHNSHHSVADKDDDSHFAPD